ncbi:hypothetical protein WJX73_007515 [Symbiochloris irregularis]|uniref:Uncharacterized protein n=1 Tax=Symbiochloris irregularis TaxID=706552 RepID=A0AAW1PFD5_9CHLO
MAAISRSADDEESLPELIYSDEDAQDSPDSLSSDELPPLEEYEIGLFAGAERYEGGEEDEDEEEEDERDEEEEDDDDEEEEDEDHLLMIEPEDFDEEQELCWCPGCTQQRLIDIVNAPYSGLGNDAGDFVSPVAEMLRQRMEGRAPGADPNQLSSSEDRSEHAGSSASASAQAPAPPLDRIPVFLPLGSPELSVSQGPGAEPPDLPSASKRLACSRKADVLGGQRPPAGLARLLASPQFLQGVLSRLPGVDAKDAALEALSFIVCKGVNLDAQPPHQPAAAAMDWAGPAADATTNGSAQGNNKGKGAEREGKARKKREVETTSLRKEVEALVNEFKDRFPADIPAGLPPERDNMYHCIPLKPGEEPSFRKGYRLTPAEKAEVELKIADLLDKGWIEPAHSPYGAPILFVGKKDGDTV